MVPETALPANVRNGTDEQKQAYKAALGFERLLLGQLMQSMTDTAQGTGDDESGDAASNMYKQMLPDQLADSMIASGGTGLADDLYRALQGGRS